MRTFLIIILIFVILFLILREFWFVYVLRSQKRKIIFDLAKQKAKETCKPLLVLGNPHADNYSFSKADYGCGDMCVDLTGCPLCINYTKEKLENYLPKLADNSYVVFASCILEYVDNLPEIKKQLERISGGDLFIVNIEPNSLKTKFFPNLGYVFKRKYVLKNCPPYSKGIIFYPI